MSWDEGGRRPRRGALSLSLHQFIYLTFSYSCITLYVCACTCRISGDQPAYWCGGWLVGRCCVDRAGCPLVLFTALCVVHFILHTIIVEWAVYFPSSSPRLIYGRDVATTKRMDETTRAQNSSRWWDRLLAWALDPEKRVGLSSPSLLQTLLGDLHPLCTPLFSKTAREARKGMHFTGLLWRSNIHPHLLLRCRLWSRSLSRLSSPRCQDYHGTETSLPTNISTRARFGSGGSLASPPSRQQSPGAMG